MHLYRETCSLIKVHRGKVLRNRFEATGDVDVLEQALAVTGKAVRLAASASSSTLAIMLNRFYAICRAGYLATDDRRWWDRYIAMQASIIMPKPGDITDPHEQAEWAELHVALGYRLHERGQCLADAEAANTAAHDAVQFAVRSNDMQILSMSLALWTNTLQRLAFASVDVTELIDAERFLFEGARVATGRERALAWRLWSALGVVQRAIYGVSSDRAPLDHAITSNELALGLVSPDEPPKEVLETGINLVVALRYRYQEDGAETDRDKAFTVLRYAHDIASASTDPSYLAKVRYHASRLHEVVAGYTSEPTTRAAERRRAAHHARQALDLTPPDGSQEYFERATQVLWTHAAVGDSASPQLMDSIARTLTAAQAIALQDRLLTASGYQSDDGVAVFDTAAALLEAAAATAIPGSAEYADFRYSQGMVSLHAGTGISQDERNRRSNQLLAEVLDQPGSSATSRVGAGTELGWMRAFHGEWDEAADALESAIDALASFGATRLSLEQQLRRTIAATGATAGDNAAFGIVSLAATCAVLSGDTNRALMLVEKGLTSLTGNRATLSDVPSLTTQGTAIVAVFSSPFGAYAIVITASSVEAIQLPTNNSAIEQYSALSDATPSDPVDENRVHGVLEWLWTTVASPVFDHLSEQGCTPTRIWWLPVGWYAFLPLHAAGFHREEAGNTVMDRCVSSYLTSLGSLRDHHAQPAARPDFRDSLAVAGPHLDAAAYEAEKVAKILGSRLPPLTGGEATVTNVLAHSHGVKLIHFACHGHANPTRPSDSHLELNDGRLTVARLTGTHPGGSWLAYLSACLTSSPSFLLNEQPVHTTSAFQQAGYRHVIGTLWPIPDDPRPAQAFYHHLTTTDPADALRRTTLDIRHKNRQRPSHWAAFIHFGPEA